MLRRRLEFRASTAGRVVEFGDLLRQFRVAAGPTQAELAERPGLSMRGVTCRTWNVRLAARRIRTRSRSSVRRSTWPLSSFVGRALDVEELLESEGSSNPTRSIGARNRRERLRVPTTLIKRLNVALVQEYLPTSVRKCHHVREAHSRSFGCLPFVLIVFDEHTPGKSDVCMGIRLHTLQCCVVVVHTAEESLQKLSLHAASTAWSERPKAEAKRRRLHFDEPIDVVLVVGV